MIFMIFTIFIFCSLKRTFHAFGVKIKFCINLRKKSVPSRCRKYRSLQRFQAIFSENVKLLEDCWEKNPFSRQISTKNFGR